MADFSFDSLGQLASSSLKGVTGTVAGAGSNKLLGSAATSVGNIGGGLITGAAKAGNNILAGYVGGAENLKAVESAASTVTGTVSALYNGETTFSEVGEKISGSVSSLLDGDMSGSIMGAVGLGIPGLSGLENDYGSDWGTLSPLLMARLYVCNAKGVPDVVEFGGVYGPMVEGSFEVTLNWQSPFENTGPETKAPALTAMLQSGSLVPVLNALQAFNPSPSGPAGQAIDATAGKLKVAVHELEGRTGMTKLNSRQVFSGMPPVRLNFSMVFRAIHDAKKEVMRPLQRLMEWTFPQELAEEGILAEVLKTTTDVESFIKALFPSRAPLLLAMNHGGRTYAPLVVESISFPLDAPIDSMGNYIDLTVQISMATLTALDRPDIKRFFNS